MSLLYTASKVLLACVIFSIEDIPAVREREDQNRITTKIQCTQKDAK